MCRPAWLRAACLLHAVGEGVQAAADQAGSKVGGAVDSVKGLATEAGDTARAAGESVGRLGQPVVQLQAQCTCRLIACYVASTNQLLALTSCTPV